MQLSLVNLKVPVVAGSKSFVSAVAHYEMRMNHKTAANTPAALLPEIMLHIRDLMLNFVWQYNLLL